MIRILQVVNYMDRGGLETMLMNYYRNIDRDQIQFDFLTHRSGRFDYDDEIKAMGGKIYTLPNLNPFSITYRNRLCDFFDKHPEYKIIHVHRDCLSSIVLKEAKRHNVPIRIAHAHSSSQDKNIKLIIKQYYKSFIPKYATSLFACGKEAGDWMFNGAPYNILNNAIDAVDYIFNENIRNDMRQKLGIENDELVIGHVGRFYDVKNHRYLVEVFKEICKSMRAKLIMVGDGVLREEIENTVKDHGLSDKVIFTGVRSNVSDYLQAMDVFVFPSKYEGLPVTLVEAQAAGLPCVVSDNVPPECKKTDLVMQLSLSDGLDKWALEVINASHIKRIDRYEAIKASGFDIKSNAKALARYYIKKYEQIK